MRSKAGSSVALGLRRAWLLALVLLPAGACRPDQTTNESNAVLAIRSLNTAQITYRTSNDGLYGDLDDLAGAGLIDERFSEGAAVGGYLYTITLGAGGVDYEVNAEPVSERTGRFSYYSGPDQVVRYRSGPGVTRGDPVP